MARFYALHIPTGSVTELLCYTEEKAHAIIDMAGFYILGNKIHYTHYRNLIDKTFNKHRHYLDKQTKKTELELLIRE